MQGRGKAEAPSAQQHGSDPEWNSAQGEERTYKYNDDDIHRLGPGFLPCKICLVELNPQVAAAIEHFPPLCLITWSATVS